MAGFPGQATLQHGYQGFPQGKWEPLGHQSEPITGEGSQDQPPWWVPQSAEVGQDCKPT